MEEKIQTQKQNLDQIINDLVIVTKRFDAEHEKNKELQDSIHEVLFKKQITLVSFSFFFSF